MLMRIGEDYQKGPEHNAYGNEKRTNRPAIRDQARAFKDHLEKVIAFYMKEAISSDRVTVYNAIKDAGYDKLAEHIRRL